MTLIKLMNEIKQLLDSNVPEDTLVMAKDCVAYRHITGHLTRITKEDADNHGDCERIIGKKVFVL